MKKFLDCPAAEQVFLRQALAEGLRLDSRTFFECRDVEIVLSRDECRSEASVRVHNTKVACIVTGEIIAPFPDRPNEGILQFSADVSSYAEQMGIAAAYVTRVVERSIRESDTMDTESLCIVAGEKVWCINCDIRLLNYDGNALDACNLATIAAYQAFRKPDVTVSRGEGDISSIHIHHSDVREPLPLALHHAPLSITFGIICNPSQEEGSEHILLMDPSLEEERIIDGKLTFSVNAHSELCAIQKPGGVAITIAMIATASRQAIKRAAELHQHLNSALAALETNFNANRAERLANLQKQYQLNMAQQQEENMVVDVGDGGLNINDPVLSFQNIHVAAGLGPSKA